MASSVRSLSKALPRVSMARIPVVVFANSANSAHPSAYSSMPPRKNKDSWADTAKKTADKLEHSAQNLASHGKDYLREVKQYDSPDDEVMMELGLAMSGQSHGARGNEKQKNSSGGRQRPSSSFTSPGFEQSLVDQVQADVINPGSKKNQERNRHQQELVSTLCQQLKAEKQVSNLSQHASDAIRMVESHSFVKHDKAPIHSIRDEDPTDKHQGQTKRK